MDRGRARGAPLAPDRAARSLPRAVAAGAGALTARRRRIAVVTGAVLVALAGVYTVYRAELAATQARLRAGSLVAATACGLIEYAASGNGPAVLLVHGAGGGYFQLAEMGRALAAADHRVIAVSRFGYQRTPLPADASADAQAAAHGCLLDHLGIDRSAVIGISAGGPSALRFCQRESGRCTALVLIVPGTFAPGTRVEATTPPSPWMRFVLDHVLTSDFAMWAIMRVAPGILVETALATPMEVYRAASEVERERVLAMARDIFPVSPKAAGLANDAGVTEGLPPEALQEIRVPTLVISADDDLYGTDDAARYTAAHIPGALLVVYPTGGHMLVDHDRDSTNEVLAFLATEGSNR